MWKYFFALVALLAVLETVRLCWTHSATPAPSTCRCDELDIKLHHLKQQLDALAKAHHGFRCTVIMNWDKVVEINQKRLARQWGEDAPLEIQRAARPAHLDCLRKEIRDHAE